MVHTSLICEWAPRCWRTSSRTTADAHVVYCIAMGSIRFAAHAVLPRHDLLPNTLNISVPIIKISFPATTKMHMPINRCAMVGMTLPYWVYSQQCYCVCVQLTFAILEGNGQLCSSRQAWRIVGISWPRHFPARSPILRWGDQLFSCKWPICQYSDLHVIDDENTNPKPTIFKYCPISRTISLSVFERLTGTTLFSAVTPFSVLPFKTWPFDSKLLTASKVRET